MRFIYTALTCVMTLCHATVPTPPASLVNAFIRLTFYPLPLRILHGSVDTGYVNVTVMETGYYSNDLFTLHGYCTNRQVARVARNDGNVAFVPDGPSWFIFNITVHALRLGETQIRFYVTRNSTSSGRHPGEHRRRYSKPEDEIRTPGQWNHSAEENGTRRTEPRHLDGNATDPHISASAAVQDQRRPSSPDPVAGRPIGAGVANYSEDWPGDDWWLIGSYEIVVKRPTNWIESWLDYVVMAFIALNLIGIGGQIDVDEALFLIKTPTALSLALFCRFGVMPAVGLGLLESLKSSHTVFLGVLSMLCSPHEGANCLLGLLANNDLTLTVTMTCVINFAAVALLPLWTILFESRIYPGPGHAKIPFREMFFLFGYILTSVVIGFFLERRCPKLYAKYWTYLPTFTIATVLFILAAEVYKSGFVFQLVTTKVFLVASTLALAGYLFGAAVAFVARQPLSRILVVSLETGCRTTYVTCLLLTGSLECPDCDIARTTPVLGCILSLAPGLVAVLIYRLYAQYKGLNYAETVSTLATSKEADDTNEITELKETSM